MLTNDLDRTVPLRTKDMNALRDSMPIQESVLMALPVAGAPRSPILPEHQGQTEAFDEFWLAGTWKFKSEEMDWENLVGVGGQVDLDMKALLETLRRTFEIRGPYRNTIGFDENARETIPGYHCLTPGAGNWVWVTILYEHGSEDVGIVDDRIRTHAAYRIGDTLWLEEEQGIMLPYVKE